MKRLKCYDCKCFTLVELLIVIAVVAILTSLLLPALKKAKDMAARTACMNNQKQIYAAMLTYGDDFGHLPNKPEYYYINNDLDKKPDMTFFCESYLGVKLLEWHCFKYPVRGFDTPLHCPGSLIPNGRFYPYAAKIDYQLWTFNTKLKRLQRPIDYNGNRMRPLMLGDFTYIGTLENFFSHETIGPFINHNARGGNWTSYDGSCKWYPKNELYTAYAGQVAPGGFALYYSPQWNDKEKDCFCYWSYAAKTYTAVVEKGVFR